MKTLLLLATPYFLGFILAGCSGMETPAARDAHQRTASSQAVALTADPDDALSLPLCSDPQPSYVTGTGVHKPASMAEPPARTPFRDPSFGTCLVRVTDRDADLAAGDRSPGLKNEYSRVQSFNADGRYILVRSIEAEWYLYDAFSLQPLGRLPLVVEPRWDAQDPSLIYHTDGTRLMAYDVDTEQETLVRDFANEFQWHSLAAVWTAHEGRPSQDTRYWALMAEDDDWLPVAFLTYDRFTDKVVVRDMRGVPGIEEDVDHVTMSPLGTYFLASFDRVCENEGSGDDDNPCGLMVYNRDLTAGRSLLRVVGHYDTALDRQGREVIVYQDIDTDQISILDLEGGGITPLWPIDFSHTPIGLHFSGLAHDRPGWALVSTYSGGYPDAFTWMDDQVFAVELGSGGRVVRLAHTHSQVDPDQEHDYWAEPHASVNGDFSRVLFTSNWGRSGTEEVEMYMIELPADWTDTMP